MADTIPDESAFVGGQRNFLPAAQEVKTWEATTLPAPRYINTSGGSEFHE